MREQVSDKNYDLKMGDAGKKFAICGLRQMRNEHTEYRLYREGCLPASKGAIEASVLNTASSTDPPSTEEALVD